MPHRAPGYRPGMQPAPGPLALVGSGEYLPVMQQIEAGLLDGRPPRFVQLATAAAPEGQRSLARWHTLGARAAERLGVEQVVIPVVDRISADDEALAATVAGAGLIYLSGGNPVFLTETLRGTRVWAAIVAAWRAGAALAGCSAGAMAMSAHVPDLRHPLGGGLDGLGLVPRVTVVPHFDRFAGRLPAGWVTRFAGDGRLVIGIDEDTALVGGPGQWQVAGRQSVWLLGPDGKQEFASGSPFTVPD